MNAFAECMPCLLNLALTTARTAGCDEAGKMKALKVAIELMANMDLDRPPPTIAADLLPEVNRAIGVDDPFLKIKRESNRVAKDICRNFTEGYMCEAGSDKDRLARAIRISIAGNIIDFAVAIGMEWEKKIIELTETELVQVDTAWVERMRSMLLLIARTVDLATVLLALAVVDAGQPVEGGEIVVAGTVGAVVECAASHTGAMLRRFLHGS